MMEALKIETAESVKCEVLGQRRQSNVYSDKEPIRLPRFMRVEVSA